MSFTTRIDAELARISAPATDDPALLPGRLARACARILGAAGAGISVFATDGFRFPAGASDDDSAAAERLQFTVGVGPCLDAHAAGQPITATAEVLGHRWPEFQAELERRTPFRAITSVPMTSNPVGLGCVDLYFHDDAEMHRLVLSDARDAVQHTYALLVGEDPDVPPAWVDGTTHAPRNRVMMAVGMLNVSLGVTSEQALALLRGHAFALDVSVDEVARLVAERRIPVSALDPAGNG